MSSAYLQALSAACLCSGVFSVFASEKNAGLDRCIRFVLTLALTASLLLPLKDTALSALSLPSLFRNETAKESTADGIASVYRFESGVRQMLADKFGLSRDEADVRVSFREGGIGCVTVVLGQNSRGWLIGDVESYLRDRLDCEVIVLEQE